MTITIVIIALVAAGITFAVVLIRRKMAAAGKRWLDLLKAHPGYSGKAGGRPAEVRFQYARMDDENLQRLRQTYDLDAVAGDGSEAERLIALMKWVNHLTWHHPNPKIPGPYNAPRLIALCKGHRRGINCWMFALILNEVYLSMGFASRLVHLQPYSGEDRESHFVVAVFSPEAGRWLFMDPDFGGYFMDEQGGILGIPEIRRRLVEGRALIANRDVRGFTSILGKGSYPWYLSKNIFKYMCAQSSGFDQESNRQGEVYYRLIPDGYEEGSLLEPKTTPRGSRIISVNNEALFWQEP